MIVSQIATVSAGENIPTEEDFFAPIPTVTTSARLEKSLLELGASVTIIDRDMIEASTAIEIPDLLRLVPGFQVALANGALFAVGYHGATDQWPRRMEVMVDGRSVYLNSLSSVEWNALGLAIEDIERIEVVRGPNAPVFGSNAMLGSINIVTRAPFDLAGKYLRGTLGSQNTGIGVARWGGKIGEWNTSLTAQYREDDGFENVDDHKRLRDLRLRSDYQATFSDTISVQLGLTDGVVGADGKPDPEKDQPFRDRDIRSNYQQLTWHRNETDGNRYRFVAYHNYYDTDDTYLLDINDFNPGAFLPLGFYTATSERYDLEFQHNLEPRDQWRFAWGLGGRYDKLSSDLLLFGEDEVARYSGRVFGSGEWKPVEDLTLSLDILTESHESFGTETSPRFAVNWLASDSRSFRASASRSYRVFNLLARNINVHWVDTTGFDWGQALVSVLQDNFTPEQITGYEIGYTESWIDHRLFLDLRVFHEELDDPGMDASLDGTTIWRDEGGGWDTTGLEIQVDYRPTRDTRFVGAYSLADIDGKIGTGLDENGEVNEYRSLDDTAPNQTLSLLLSHRFTPQWRASLALYHMDEVRWLGGGSEVDDYTRLDFKLTRDFELGDTGGQVALIAQNLTDDKYSEFRNPGRHDRLGNVFERRVYFQMSLQFH